MKDISNLNLFRGCVACVASLINEAVDIELVLIIILLSKQLQLPVQSVSNQKCGLNVSTRFPQITLQ